MKGEIKSELCNYIAGLQCNITSLQCQVTFIAGQVATLLAHRRNDQESSLTRQVGLAIARDLGTINQSYGFSRLSQVKRLVRDYKLKCEEIGEAIFLPSDTDIDMDIQA